MKLTTNFKLRIDRAEGGQWRDPGEKSPDTETLTETQDSSACLIFILIFFFPFPAMRETSW